MFKRGKKEDEKEQSFIDELRIAYRNLENPKEFYTKTLVPSILLGIMVCILPFILPLIIHISFNPITFIIGGIIPIFLGILYPYISWKNKETEINGNMHFFITHLRVLAISDLSLKDIINVLGDKPVYKSLGEEIKKISVLCTKWRYPLAKTFHFIAVRTPSKILKDFLDRFSQSLDSGVEHREFIEIEQHAVMEEYKTMYETSNENILILNEIYVSLLIAIIFIMAMGIVLPFIMGAETMSMYVYLSSFLILVSEGLLLYLIKAILPADEIWHKTGEKGGMEQELTKTAIYSLFYCGIIAIVLFLGRNLLSFLNNIPFEILVMLSLTPLMLVGIKTYKMEEEIFRMEKNFLGFLPALGSISTMKGGKINESVYYLSRKDYGVLTKHIRNLYRRLRTRINDDEAWQWFGVDTGSNIIQRSSEMFREATFAAATPRKVAQMITENMRKIFDLRKKKLTIVNTTTALFGGITFGISFAIYVSLVISKHMNDIMIKTGDPFKNISQINMEALLQTVDPNVYTNITLVIFIVLLLHSFILSFTIKTLRGSHFFITLLYFVPFSWIVTITSVVVENILSRYLAAGG